MTSVSYVSQKEMEKRTGFGKALGYAFPKEDEILIRKGLPDAVERMVKKHEEEHILKGEEGPGIFDFLGDIFASGKQSKSADKATKAQVKAADDQIRYAQETRDMTRGDQAPYREAGYTALDALMSMTGLGRSAGGGSAPAPLRNINAGDYLGGFGGGTGPVGPRRPALRMRAYGGPMGADHYNVNELGPEDVYQDGSYTRSPNPHTIAPVNGGYVKPHGRAIGGGMKYSRMLESGWGGPQSLQNGPQTASPQPAQAPSTAPTGYVQPRENPGGVEGGYNFQTDPGYEFRLNEGQRVLERGAAANGGLMSGGFARRAIRYGQDYASNEYTNVYNRIAAIAGIGQSANNASGQAALYTGAQMGNAASDAGYARASGYAANGNIWGNAIQSGASAMDDWWTNRKGVNPYDEANRDASGGYG